MRVVVVGCGSISREFSLQHFGRATGTTVAALVDPDAAAAASLAADVGSVDAGAKVSAAGGNKYRSAAAESRGEPVPHFRSLTDALAGSPDASLVYVGTPPSTHAALVREALAAGRHVLMEKPLAASPADADAIVTDAEASKGLVVGVNLGMRYNAALAEMRRRALDAEAFGPIGRGALRLHFSQWPREWQTQPWCARRAQGGPLREVGTHFFHGILELFGASSVKRVRADVAWPDGAGGTLAESRVDGELEALVPGAAAAGQEPLVIALSVRTDGTLLGDSGRDVYELELTAAAAAAEDGGGGGGAQSLLLHSFTSLSATPRGGGARERLVSDADYGRKECVRSLLREARGEAVPQAERVVTPREARGAQRVLDALLASGGAWVAVDYD